MELSQVEVRGIAPRSTAVRVANRNARCNFRVSPPDRLDAGRRGWIRALQQISSLSMFPSPAMTDWFIRVDFTVARLPRRSI
jgi:hypothetical protein